MGGACGTYGEEERRVQGFGGEPERESHMEGLGVGRIILCYTRSVLPCIARIFVIRKRKELYLCDNQQATYRCDDT
jgi:hypothetical protein